MDYKNQIVKIAKQTIEIEADTINNLLDSIDDEFISAVDKIFKSTGKIVVTGIGKSAIIAQKITATFNSTGTASIFMHAADAIHGDLGMIQENDLVLCISKSGNTPEIKVLVPMLKTLGTALIGMAANKDSYLATHADILLHTPVAKEADPNNLAPTASTTAQLVMGDCIATTLLALRGFTAKDFAQYHPGGSLGKKLYLRVSDLYQIHQRPLSRLNDALKEVIMEITSSRLGATVVTDGNNKVLGIITDGDLRRMLTSNADVDKLTAKDIMSTDPKTIQKNEMAVQALEIMRANSITQIIVVDGEEYLGIVHLHDLLNEGIF